MNKASQHKFNSVFSRSPRVLKGEELVQVGGGYKNLGGVDNQSREWNSMSSNVIAADQMAS
ncbi:hypothetical protein K3175_05745 [Qipengyuania sp. GH1]|uniref:hypothetical protein n=1 Tax=Qipengyuania aestuarii TaxID=2867241 RepID=UPI001C88C735|nr:hypothetical protein [Qipengyuania aestuarii]MBX7535156.1 hypothetical protein [Qipengyuania aestuarii]